jgi:hypothetical protein
MSWASRWHFRHRTFCQQVGNLPIGGGVGGARNTGVGGGEDAVAGVGDGGAGVAVGGDCTGILTFGGDGGGSSSARRCRPRFAWRA